MPKVLVCYYSKTGNTKEMAQLIARGAEDAGVEVVLKRAKDVKGKEFGDYDGVVIGSPTYFGVMAAEIKDLLDRSIAVYGKLSGRAGGAFTSSGNLAGGNETTIISILQALLIHGMVIQGDHQGSHYGPVAVGAPDERAREECIRYGGRFAELVKRLNP